MLAMAGEVFKSRFTFIAAAVGMAVGTGNLWRFPRVVGEYGGGAFLIAIIIANLVWAVPVLMSESLLGSKSRLGTVGAVRGIEPPSGHLLGDVVEPDTPEHPSHDHHPR